MRFLSPILRQAVYPVLAGTGYFHRQASAALRVITYHGILPEAYRRADSFLDNTLIDVAQFRAQLALLKKHYNVIAPQDFLGWLRKSQELPRLAVLLTCDDGLLNNLTTMVPVLQEERLQCLFFVTSGPLENGPAMLWYVELYLLLMQAKGSHPPISWRGVQVPAIPVERAERVVCWLQTLKILSRFGARERFDFLRDMARWCGVDPEWKRRILDDPLLRQRFQLLSGADLKRLVEAGMSIGAHTMSHPALVEQTDELARAEIEDSRSALQKCSGQPVWAIAYSFGDPASVGNREYRLAESAGYECGFMNVGGAVGQSDFRFSLPRIHVTAEMSLSVYEAHISGFQDALQRRFRRSGSTPAHQPAANDGR